MTHPQLMPHPIDLDAYHRMIEAGILTEDDPVELIEGQIVTMSPKGSKHAACIGKINAGLTPRLGGQAQLRLQDPIQIPDLSEPEPDLALVQPRADFYAEAHPLPGDVILLVEVADSSLRIDREVKAPLYAAAGIAHYWIVNLVEQQVEQYAIPQGDRYQALRTAQRGETVKVPGLGIEVAVGDWMV